MNLDTVLPRAKSRGRQMVGGTMRHAKVEAGVVALIAVGCILFAQAGSLQLTIAAFTLVWLLMGQSWNIISGMAGPLALGQAAFFGTSDFLSIWLHTNAGLNTWLAILLALLASAAMAAVLGALALRLPFFYFAIASLMVPLILESLAEYGGFYQLLRPSYPSATFAQFWWPTAYAYVIIGAIAVTLVAVFTARLGGVRTGRFFLAIRENQRAAEATGVPTSRYKVYAFVLSAVIAGFAGILYGQLTYVFDPTSVFDPSISIEALVIALVGGAGTILGPAIGAIIVVPATELTLTYLSQAPGLNNIAYAILLFAVAMWFPRGVYPTVAAKVSAVRQRRRQAAADGSQPESMIGEEIDVSF